jgi:WhiB family redox-sensing transcriptional regulator
MSANAFAISGERPWGNSPAGSDLPGPQDWVAYALCAQTDPEAFHLEKGGSTRQAKKVCSGCEVRAECLTYALEHNERFGVWGGLSERERRQLDGKYVKAYPCPHCLFSFDTSSALHQHTIKKHVTSNGDVQCSEPDCSRNFPDKTSMVAHRRRAHEGFNPKAKVA